MDLRFVAKESDYLILEDSTGERHRVLIDDDVRDALKRSQQQMQTGISPREVQTRLRAGETIEAVASVMGVTVDAIEPFAAPILDELKFVLEAAMDTQITDGDAMVPLREVIERENPESTFTAKRVDDGWIISAVGAKTLTWKYDPRSKSIEPQNSAASDLHKSHASRDIITSTIPVVAEPEATQPDETEQASVHDLVEELRARRSKPEPVRPATAKGRASLPSWDEIVLGTNQGSDSDSD